MTSNFPGVGTTDPVAKLETVKLMTNPARVGSQPIFIGFNGGSGLVVPQSGSSAAEFI